MAESYTHDFKMEFDGAVYQGEIEFNDDGIVSYEFDDTYSLTLEQTAAFTDLIKVWHRLFKAFGDNIKLVRLKEKS